MLFAELRNKYYGTNEGWGQQDTVPLPVKEKGGSSLFEKGTKKGTKAEEIQQRAEIVYREIVANPATRNIDLENVLGLSKKQILLALNLLQDTGKIHRDPANRKGKWIID